MHLPISYVPSAPGRLSGWNPGLLGFTFFQEGFRSSYVPGNCVVKIDPARLETAFKVRDNGLIPRSIDGTGLIVRRPDLKADFLNR